MSCEVITNCLQAGSACWHCKFSGEGVDNCYVPIDKKIKHPQVLAVAAERKQEKKDAKIKARVEKDKEKSAMVRKAAKAEEKVKKTLNSGRVFNDGDLTAEDIGMDLKTQSTRVNPVLDVKEFKKCEADALRAGKRHGVLILENKDGERFYVVSEQLFKERFI